MNKITVELTEDEYGNLMAIIDAGVKGMGVQAVLPLTPVLSKLNAAIAAKSNGAMGSPDAGPDIAHIGGSA